MHIYKYMHLHIYKVFVIDCAGRFVSVCQLVPPRIPSTVDEFVSRVRAYSVFCHIQHRVVCGVCFLAYYICTCVLLVTHAPHICYTFTYTHTFVTGKV